MYVLLRTCSMKNLIISFKKEQQQYLYFFKHLFYFFTSYKQADSNTQIICLAHWVLDSYYLYNNHSTYNTTTEFFVSLCFVLTIYIVWTAINMYFVVFFVAVSNMLYCKIRWRNAQNHNRQNINAISKSTYMWKIALK